MIMVVFLRMKLIIEYTLQSQEIKLIMYLMCQYVCPFIDKIKTGKKFTKRRKYF